MGKICANFRITTPMFLGGADNENTAELRPTSVKGALRFWFRAMNYGKYQDYKKVKKAEDDLFGSTNTQSSFFLKLNSEAIKVETNEEKIRSLFAAPEIGYLGYGLFQRSRRQFYRPYLIPGQTFTVELLLKSKSKNQLTYGNLIKATKALGLFGGLGSRSRRGFGSVTLDSIYVDDKECWVAPNSREELRNTFKDFYQVLELSRNIPEYTAFSSDTRTIILDEFSDYKEALKSVGRSIMDFRRDCDKDTDIVIDALGGRNIDKHPERVVFGLPHNYSIRGQGKVDINPVIDSGGTRRSSPLFIRIISIKEGRDIKYIPVMTVIPSEFLPKGSKISLKSPRKSYTLEPKVSFDLINEFMGTFPSRLEVRPLD
ncbi:MAG TPA: type III-B CRISPR module RAMP protein Cmr1 [Thermoanaerobacterales bacterium]|nr:type III-B CRISPR module RAMP protein Cmr1 [Thermoanaerobacterales bacterium]